jgi:hypothetical protein
MNDIPPQEFGYLQATVDKLEDRVEKLTAARYDGTFDPPSTEFPNP